MDIDNYFDSVNSYCQYEQYQEEPPIEPSLAESVASLLKLDLKHVEWVMANFPIDAMRLVEKAKRVVRRERAKLRTRMMMGSEQTTPMTNIPMTPITPVVNPLSPIPYIHTQDVQQLSQLVLNAPKKRGKRKQKEFSDTQSTSDEQNQKKMVQMIRNRISAQISRDKKKEYLQGLEQAARYHEEQNQHLKRQLMEMQMKKSQAEEENGWLKQQLCQKSKKIHKVQQNYIRVGQELISLVEQFVSRSPLENLNHQLDSVKSQMQSLLVN